ncbi:MAG: ABC transporter permease [Clostridia bacterium]|nr:ABC transporter permease [Clostridia bacterium]
MQVLIKSLRKPVVATIMSLLLGFLVTAIVLVCLGNNPIEVFAAWCSRSLSQPKYISNVLIQSTPLILLALGVSFAFKSGLINIGAEGQFIAGTLTATIVGCVCNFHPVIQIPLVIIAGILGGLLCGLIEGYLKARFGINEIVSGIMVNWTMLYVSNFFVSLEYVDEGPSIVHRVNESSFINLTLPEGVMQNLQTNVPWLYDFLAKPDVNFGFLIAIAVAIAMVWFFKKTTMGYELKVAGLGKPNCEIAGMSVVKKITLSLTIAGAICGLAGALVVMGMEPHKMSQLAAFQGNGFTRGMSISFIAAGSPIASVFLGIIFSALFYGAESAQSQLGVPTDIVNITIGISIFCMALVVIFPRLADKLEQRRKK